MNLFSFTANFGSEESCRLHFKEERDKIGVQCKCGNKEHFWIKSVWSYECKKCRSRISLRSGTIMQSSNLSFFMDGLSFKDSSIDCLSCFGLLSKRNQQRKIGLL